MLGDLIGGLIYVAIGVLAWAGAALLLSFRSEALRKRGLIRRTQTSRVADVYDAPAGTLVEVEGILRCESPLTSEMAAKTCAYYRSEVDRRYQRELPRDSEGRPIGSPMQQVKTVLSKKRFAPFVVEDDSGAVGVRAEGAEVDALEVMNRFERVGFLGEDRGITCGGITVDPADPGSGRTLGYRCVESILPIDSPVYVLGVVQEDGQIGAPPVEDEEKEFLISYQPEEQLEEDFKGRVLLYTFAALLLFVIGTAFIAYIVAVALGFVES